MLKHFRLIPFIIGLVLGGFIFFFYVTPPPVVYQYPHPDNVKDRVYRDKDGLCYSYTSLAVDCDKNESTLKQYPLQG
jgi:hypothetical protein